MYGEGDRKLNTKKFKVTMVTEFTGDDLTDCHKKIETGQYPKPRITNIEVDYRS